MRNPRNRPAKIPGAMSIAVDFANRKFAERHGLPKVPTYSSYVRRAIFNQLVNDGFVDLGKIDPEDWYDGAKAGRDRFGIGAALGGIPGADGPGAEPPASADAGPEDRKE